MEEARKVPLTQEEEAARLEEKQQIWDRWNTLRQRLGEQGHVGARKRRRTRS